jgi:hypothetical protein
MTRKRWILWLLASLFIIINILLLTPTANRQYSTWGIVFHLTILCLAGLTIYFRQYTAQWRSILFAWLIYAGFRFLGAMMAQAQNSAGMAISFLLFTCAMTVGFTATVLLAIRRDESLKFLAIVVGIAPVLIYRAIIDAGGMFTWLQESNSSGIEAFSPLEPLVMASNCMLALFLPTFINHFCKLLYKELSA